MVDDCTISNAEELAEAVRGGLQILCGTEEEKLTLIRWMIEQGFNDEADLLSEGDITWPYVWCYYEFDTNGDPFFTIEASSKENDDGPCVTYDSVRRIVEGETEFPIGKITKREFEKAFTELLSIGEGENVDV